MDGGFRAAGIIDAQQQTAVSRSLLHRLGFRQRKRQRGFTEYMLASRQRRHR